uniref:Uncharacterized protein n=1 Tax=Magallana gigas TaxID=29159 RepID=K1QB89_MAGGI
MSMTHSLPLFEGLCVELWKLLPCNQQDPSHRLGNKSHVMLANPRATENQLCTKYLILPPFPPVAEPAQ